MTHLLPALASPLHGIAVLQNAGLDEIAAEARGRVRTSMADRWRIARGC